MPKMSESYKLPWNNFNPQAHEYVEQTAIIELAYGLSLPNDSKKWPIGLQATWNKACKAGIFDSDGCCKLGELANRFLQWRLDIRG